MKKIIFTLAFICCAALGHAQTFKKYEYAYSDSVFRNPERGFYKYTERNDASSSLDAGTLNSYRESGYTLIYRIFYMRDFVHSPISQAYLNKIKEDFSRMREAGIKGVIRFAYTSSMTAPYGDASPDQIAQHIGQLKPILTENSDVIAVLQAGFIGAWGEWYYTDYFATGSPSNVTDADLKERKTLLDQLLDALPSDRMIQVRYVGYKIKLYDSIPVSVSEAYSGTGKSRIAHHNDCFVSSDNDVGSYRNIVKEKKYLEQDTKYTPIGGETCEWYEPRSNCDTSTMEMKRFHWSFINQDYFGQTISEWQQNGCYNEMVKKLGYRYALINAEIQDSARQNGSFSFTFSIKNNGYANPYNPRNVEVVLKSKSTGQLFYFKLPTEIRKQEINTVFQCTAQVGIPSYLPNGDYEVYLNLPDPKPGLHNNPFFSIRLANPGGWDKSLGMNSFKHILHIHKNASGNTYTGNDYFLASGNLSQEAIQIDGLSADWNNIPVADSSSTNGILKKVKIYNAGDSLYFLLQGNTLYPNDQIFIDADFDANTGMNLQTWGNDGGMDYLVQNKELFRYNGPNGSTGWTWSSLSNQIKISKNDNVVELAVPQRLFSAPELKNRIRFGVKNVSNDWVTGEYLPEKTTNLLIYQMIPFLNPPNLYVTSYCQNAIVSFPLEEQDTSGLIIIERSMEATKNFSTLTTISGLSGSCSFKDSELQKNSSYYYRAYRIRNEVQSPYSSIKQSITGDCIYKYPVVKTDALDGDWNAIVPLTGVTKSNTDVFFKAYTSTNALNILLKGDSIVNYSVYIDTDGNGQTGASNQNWKTSGFDFTCTNDSVYQFNIKNGIAKIDSIHKGIHAIEFKIPLKLLEVDNAKKELRFAAFIKRKNDEFYLPYKNRQPTLYERVLPPVNPQNFGVRNSSTNPSGKLIASWDKCADCDGYVLTRTDQSTGESAVFEFTSSVNQLIDNSLKSGTSYQYQVYSYNFSGRSDNSGPVVQSTTATGIQSEMASEEMDVWPVPATDAVYIRFSDIPTGSVQVKVYTMEGKLLESREYSLSQSLREMSQIELSTVNLAHGIYLLQVSTGNKLMVKKMVKM